MRRRPAAVGWGAAALGLALPVDCPGCGAPDVVLCNGCARPLDAAAPRPLAPAAWRGPGAVWAAASYAGTTSSLVVAWKDRGRLDLTAALADVLARTLAAACAATPEAGGWAGGGPVVLVPLPSSRAAVRRRGEDVVRALARAAADTARRLDDAVPLRVVPALAQRRGVVDQAGLGAAGRAANVCGRVRPAVGARPLVRGRRVVLVDDVVTTGATAAAAAHALTAAGAEVVGACAVCATPRHRPGRDGGRVSAAGHLD